MQAGRLGVGAISCTWVILRTEPSQLGPKLPRAEEPWGRSHLRHACQAPRLCHERFQFQGCQRRRSLRAGVEPPVRGGAFLRCLQQPQLNRAQVPGQGGHGLAAAEGTPRSAGVKRKSSESRVQAGRPLSTMWGDTRNSPSWSLPSIGVQPLALERGRQRAMGLGTGNLRKPQVLDVATKRPEPPATRAARGRAQGSPTLSTAAQEAIDAPEDGSDGLRCLIT